MEGKHFGNLHHLWKRITQRYDKKLDSVTNQDSSITVTAGRKIAARFSVEEGNAIKLNRDGLFVPEKAKAVQHKLKLGEVEYDGSEDVNVPVYDGEYHIKD